MTVLRRAPKKKAATGNKRKLTPEEAALRRRLDHEVDRLLNQREIRRHIVAVRTSHGGYVVKHDIVGEAIVCEVPTLEMAGCIVQALRERLMIRIAASLLHRHREKQLAKAAANLGKHMAAKGDVAILPDGTRVPWDERLRTVGATRVPGRRIRRAGVPARKNRTK